MHETLEELTRDAELATVERVVIGGENERWVAGGRRAPPAVRLEKCDDFLLPYTSGTTGRPKGVRLSHRARVLTLFAMASEYGCYSPGDGTLAIAPLLHGGGFSFCAATIFFGGTCILLPCLDPEEKLRLLSQERLTNVFMVPTHFNAIFAPRRRGARSPPGARPSRADQQRGPAVAVDEGANRRPLRRRSAVRVIRLDRGQLDHDAVRADQLRKQHCIGLPFPATTIRLRGDDGEDVAQGEVGEVLVRSPYLFSGYWNRPEEAARAFADGWLATGDLGRHDDGGYLYLVDRRDDEIVSGGVNIY